MTPGVILESRWATRERYAHNEASDREDEDVPEIMALAKVPTLKGPLEILCYNESRSD